MNEITPGRMTGSLLERAGALYDFGPAPTPVVDLPPPPPEPAARAPSSGPVPVRRGRAPIRHAAIDRDRLAERGMLLPGAGVTALAEEFRVIKRQLLATVDLLSDGGADHARSILIASAKPDEGKTFCAINLALSLAAERDVAVLLVDADFAKPDIVATLGLDDGPGLLDAIADPHADIESFVVGTDIPGLSILPAGAPDSSDTELLASRRGRQLIADLAAADPSRILVIDSPPILAASHASVLAGMVGQVALVVRADRTGERDLRDAVAAIDGCDHVQLMLNAVTYQPGGRRLGSYYGEQTK